MGSVDVCETCEVEDVRDESTLDLRVPRSFRRPILKRSKGDVIVSMSQPGA